jgi:hypothetical protein
MIDIMSVLYILIFGINENIDLATVPVTLPIEKVFVLIS